MIGLAQWWQNLPGDTIGLVLAVITVLTVARRRNVFYKDEASDLSPPSNDDYQLLSTIIEVCDSWGAGRWQPLFHVTHRRAYQLKLRGWLKPILWPLGSFYKPTDAGRAALKQWEETHAG